MRGYLVLLLVLIAVALVAEARRGRGNRRDRDRNLGRQYVRRLVQRRGRFGRRQNGGMRGNRRGFRNQNCFCADPQQMERMAQFIHTNVSQGNRTRRLNKFVEVFGNRHRNESEVETATRLCNVRRTVNQGRGHGRSARRNQRCRDRVEGMLKDSRFCFNNHDISVIVGVGGEAEYATIWNTSCADDVGVVDDVVVVDDDDDDINGQNIFP